jgi:carotenoid phi-ring synthase / carotenoid chi-ring synthase
VRLQQARVLVPADPTRPLAAPPGAEAVVVGGGIAGVSAAVVLAERGVAVRLVEAGEQLGGRLRAWPVTLPDGTTQHVEHGFHAFFRHYYTWRAILRRADPELRFLAPVGGYPVISRQFPPEDLTGLPRTSPLNLVALFARSPSLGLRDLLRSDQLLAAELLAYDPIRTTARFDAMSAAEYLAALGMTDRAQAMLFEAFARSFFTAPDALSAAELIAMFHYYFLGNPEGIAFDAPATDHATAIWDPLAAYLGRHGAEIRTGMRATGMAPASAHTWDIEVEGGPPLRTRHLVLALDPGGLRALVEASPQVADVAPRLAAAAARIQVAAPFAVTRLWLDRDVAPDRPTFSAVSREPVLDSVTVYSRLEEPSRAWARRTGGSVLELHSYACGPPDAAEATARMRQELAALWPETADARVLHAEERLEATAPAFPPGSSAGRPRVVGEARGIRLAGDGIATPFLSGLMERAAATGVLAANDILAEVGAGPEPITGGPQRGILAPLLAGRRRP